MRVDLGGLVGSARDAFGAARGGSGRGREERQQRKFGEVKLISSFRQISAVRAFQSKAAPGSGGAPEAAYGRRLARDQRRVGTCFSVASFLVPERFAGGVAAAGAGGVPLRPVVAAMACTTGRARSRLPASSTST